MPSTLTPAEREQKEVDKRFRKKKPAPSRKPSGRRAPKHDNREDRIKESDPDMNKSDKDMSLNYKQVGFSIANIASRIAAPKNDFDDDFDDLLKDTDDPEESDLSEADEATNKLHDSHRDDDINAKFDDLFRDDDSLSEADEATNELYDYSEESDKRKKLNNDFDSLLKDIDDPEESEADEALNKLRGDESLTPPESYDESDLPTPDDYDESDLPTPDDYDESDLPTPDDYEDSDLLTSEGDLPEVNSDVKKIIEKTTSLLHDLAPSVASNFSKYAKKNWLVSDNWESLFPKGKRTSAHVTEHILSIYNDIKRKSRKYDFSDLNTDRLTKKIESEWPNDEMTHWATRASIINGLWYAAKSVRGIPGSFKAPFMNTEDASAKKQIIKDIIESIDELDVKSIEDGSLEKFSVIAAIYGVVQNNPESVKGLNSSINKIVGKVTEKLDHLLDAGIFLQKWDKAMKSYSSHSVKDLEYKPDPDFERSIKSMESFMNGSDDAGIDAGELMKGMEKEISEKYGKDIPDSIKSLMSSHGIELDEPRQHAASFWENSFDQSYLIGSRVATSYDVFRGKAMAKRTATYHGVLNQGHPEGPTNTPYKSYDKRYFGKEHFASIIKMAKELMKEDWLKFGWDGGSEDAQYRAALDLAIHTADSNLYQSKIDTETYDMLLNRLAGWKHDSFTDTVYPIPSGSKRSASEMKTHYKEIVRIANDLRKTDPRRSLELLLSLRSLVAGDADPNAFGDVAQEQQSAYNPKKTPQKDGGPVVIEDSGKPTKGGYGPGDKQVKGDNRTTVRPGAPEGGISKNPGFMSDRSSGEVAGPEEDVNEALKGANVPSDAPREVEEGFGDWDSDSDDHTSSGSDSAGMKTKVDALKKAAQDGDMDDFLAAFEGLKGVVKTSGRIASLGDSGELAGLEDMSDEEIKAFLKNQIPVIMELGKSLSDEDMDKFMKEFEEMTDSVKNAAKKVTTSSVRVSISTLVRLAKEIPAAAKILMPVLIAAKKKMDKKKKKPAKTSQKETSEKKKGNPFAKKEDDKKPAKKEKSGKKAPPFGGKKAPPFGGKKAPKTSQKRKASIQISSSDADW